jgi:hypothetical protein
MLLKPYIQVFPKVLNLKTVSTIVKVASNLNYKKATVGNNVLDEKIRKVHNYELSYYSKSLTEVHWFNFLHKKIYDLMNYYLNKNKLINYYRISNINQIEILKYEKTFHYDYHIDDGFKWNRTLSSILFLNNDYEGGELSFKDPLNEEEISIKPEPGAIVVWPSNLLFPHTVKPIKNGTRYSVVAWGH